MMELFLGNFWVLLKGGAIGFAVAAPVGPIGMLCIRTTLERGRLAGFCAGLGAAVADMLFACLGALGLSLVSAFITDNALWFKLAGGLFLVGFGWHLARRRVDPRAGDEQAVPPGLVREFALTFVLTLANPTTILSFAGIFAGVSGLRGMEIEMVPALIAGVFLGSAAWWLTLSAIVGVLHHRISETAMLWINRLAGAALVAFGLATLSEPFWEPVARAVLE
jgi:threonine/homoserine/homoserine lactone efflux protein